MIDDVIHHMLNYVKGRHAEVDHEDDMQVATLRLGHGYETHDRSFYDPAAGTVYVKRTKDAWQARADAAHELAHGLALEGDPCYDEVIRRYHASVPNLDAHLERLTDHTMDLLLMPDHMVSTVLNICGLNARAVWVLHQTARVHLPTALRRLVHFNPDARMGGFIAQGGVVRHATSFRWRMPCWVGDAMPDPDDDFHGPGISLFNVPGRRSTVIAAIVIEV